MGLAAVREDVITAVERTAEGRSLSPVHPICGHHAEIQRRGHFEEHLELIHLRLVLRCRDVELDEPVHRLFARPLADAQMRCLATDRTNATGLDAELVEPAVLRPGLSEPMRCHRLLGVAGIKQMTQRSLDAETVQRRPLVFPAVVTDLGSGLADFARLDRRGRKRSVEHGHRRTVVTIYMRRRKRQLRPDAFKSMPQRILIQLARLRGIIVHAEQVIDRVLILLPAQPIMRHRRPRCHPGRPAFLDPRIQARDERRYFLLRRSLLLLRRHLARIDLLHHLRPMMRVRA